MGAKKRHSTKASDVSGDVPVATMVVKTTVNLPANIVESLRKLAAARGTSMGKVIADAIELEAYMQTRKQRGRRVLVEDDDKKLIELFLR
jgi:hypothetical protein